MSGAVLRVALLAALLSCVAGRAASIMDCGILVEETHGEEHCIFFVGNDGQSYWLDDYGEFTTGDTLFIRGTTHVPPMVLCGASHPGIGVAIMQRCRGVDFGCGTLYFIDGPFGPPCFYSWQFGSFGMGGWGGYQEGDTVQVYGRILLGCTSLCADTPCLHADSLVACTDTLTAVSPTTWGRLKALFR
jgi:hypothetical protein